MSLIPPPLAWADAVDLTLDYLRPLFAPIPVEFRMPVPDRPPSIVIVQRAGGTLDPANCLYDRPRLTFECWAPQPDQAHDLAIGVRDAMLRFPGLRDGFRVQRARDSGGPAWAPDDETDTPVYLLTIDARIRANTKGP